MSIRLLYSCWIALALVACLDTSESDESMPCNPFYKKTCFAINKALGTSLAENFHTGLRYFHTSTSPNAILYLAEKGLAMTIQDTDDYPSLKSNFYVMYGTVSASIRSSNGTGIVSSFYLQSDDLDEIDIMETLGGQPHKFQTNYYVKGNTTNYNRGTFHRSLIPLDKTYTRYKVEWTPEKISWSVNDRVVRVVEPLAVEGYPNSPMCIKFSLWPGGDPNNEIGTIQWAGGVTNYHDSPYEMNVKDVVVTDYSTGEHYVYGNVDGKWKNLNSRGGRIYGQKLLKDTFVELTSEQLDRYNEYEKNNRITLIDKDDTDDEEEEDEDDDDILIMMAMMSRNSLSME